MKSNKQLDEMQENKLLKIQEKGFWLVFWIQRSKKRVNGI